MPRLISSSPSSSRILHGSRPKLPFSTIFPSDCDSHHSSPNCRVELLAAWVVVVHGGARRVKWPMEDGFDLPSPATIDGGSWFHELQLLPLVVLVPSVRDKMAGLLSTLFKTNCQNFDS